MKIYFAGSITGGRENSQNYVTIIKHLQKHGQVLTEHIAGVGTCGEKLAPVNVFQRDVRWIHECDVIIVEVTNPSLGVGYEISLAEQLGKPVLCLFNLNSGRTLSFMIDGNEKLVVRKYTMIQEALRFIDDFVNRVS